MTHTATGPELRWVHSKKADWSIRTNRGVRPPTSCPECKGNPYYLYADGFNAPTPCSLCWP